MSMLKSRKITNILSNNKVSLTIDVRDPVNPFKNEGVMVEGEAWLEAEIHLMKHPTNRVFLTESTIKVYELFERKYPILRGEGSSVVDSQKFKKKIVEVLVSIKPTKMVYWSGGPKFQRFKF